MPDVFCYNGGCILYQGAKNRILTVEVRPVDELRDYFLGSRARHYRRAFSRVGWALTLMLLLTLAGQILLQILTAWFAPGLLSRVDVLYLISGFSTYCIAAPGALLVLSTLPAPPREGPPRPLTALQAVQLWLLCVGSSYLLNFLTQWVMDWVSRAQNVSFTDPVDQLGSLSLWVSLPLTCLLGPLVEELCFRRALLERLRPWGDGFALCASALLFALFHGNLFQSLYTLSIGLLLGGVALYTGQLRWAVGLHAAFNFLSAGLAPLAVALGSVGDLAFTALVILSMAWTLHWLVYRGEALAKAARALRWGDGETWGHFLVNPGMTVFLLAILALTWYNLR